MYAVIKWCVFKKRDYGVRSTEQRQQYLRIQVLLYNSCVVLLAEVQNSKQDKERMCVSFWHQRFNQFTPQTKINRMQSGLRIDAELSVATYKECLKYSLGKFRSMGGKSGTMPRFTFGMLGSVILIFGKSWTDCSNHKSGYNALM